MNNTFGAVTLVTVLIIGAVCGFILGQNTTCVKFPWNMGSTCVVTNPVR